MEKLLSCKIIFFQSIRICLLQYKTNFVLQRKAFSFTLQCCCNTLEKVKKCTSYKTLKEVTFAIPK